MNTTLLVGGPLVLVVIASLLIWSGAITFGEQAPGLEHQAGVEQGGAFSVTDTIEYGGKYLPLSELVINPEESCGAEHYHAKNHSHVIATDGSEVPDPGPDCGYGKVDAFAVTGLELELDPIEYRNGSEPTTVRKQPGLTKYTNIHFNPSKIKDLIFWNWVIDGTDKSMQVETQLQGGVEMKQIDPPVLVIPAN